jgi:predicted nucleic acid-binding protein
MKALFDTSILADYFRGLEKARAEIDAHADRLVSVMTCLELTSEARSDDEERAIVRFLDNFTVVDVTPEIARRAVQLRRHHALGVPDAVVFATAQAESAILVTRSSGVFPADSPGIRIPY